MISKRRTCVAEVARALESRIVGGWITEGRFLPSVRDIGQEYGCAALTAHRAVKKLAEDGYVASEPRQGYRVIASRGQDKRGVRAEMVAFLEDTEDYVEHLGSIYQAQIMTVQREAMRRDWTAVQVPYRGQSAEEIARRLDRMGATALVLQDVGNKFSPDFLKDITAIGLPVVSLDMLGGVSGMDHVLRDEAQGARVATDYLLGKGYRRIGWYGPLRFSPNGRRRFSGAAEALMREGVDIDGQGWRDIEAATLVKTAREYLLRTPRPTAVLALWQTSALALARAALELGLKLGEDLDMVGWSMEEDFERGYASVCPELVDACATVVWSLADVGRMVFDRIEERRRRSDTPDASLLLPMRLREPAPLGSE